MDLFLSKYPVEANSFVSALQIFFRSNEQVVILTKNLLDRFKFSHRLFDVDALERALESPHHALIILTEEYFQDDWLRTELSCLFALQQSRKKEGFIIPVYLPGLSESSIPNFIKESNIKAVDVRSKSHDDGVIAVANHILSIKSAHKKVFIGYGRSHAWKDLRDLLVDRFHLPFDAYEWESRIGKTPKELLSKALDESNFAFLIMTAEDKHDDDKFHARENVIHEIGLFQGRMSFERAVILLEEGCEGFSNVAGVTNIPFPKGNIKAVSEKISEVLKEQKLIV